MINVQWNLKIMGTLAKEFLRDQTHLTGTKSPFKLSCYTFHRIVNMRSVRSLALKEEHSERAEHLWMFFFDLEKVYFPLTLLSFLFVFSFSLVPVRGCPVRKQRGENLLSLFITRFL